MNEISYFSQSSFFQIVFNSNSSVCGVRARVEFSTGKSRVKPWDNAIRRAPPPPSGRRFNPDDRCYECGERGHYAYDCELRANGKRRFNSVFNSIVFDFIKF